MTPSMPSLVTNNVVNLVNCQHRRFGMKKMLPLPISLG